MLLTKKYLNELVQQKAIFESFNFSRKEDPDNYDVFISYSSHDKEFATKVVGLLKKCGYSAYADYEDLKLNRNNVNTETAERLVKKMMQCRALFYLHSKSASVSKWCPWEVGLFSGIKNFKCANLPIVESKDDTYKNQEYLGLYPYVDFEIRKNSNEYEFWVNTEDGKYVSLKEWLKGKEPSEHE